MKPYSVLSILTLYLLFTLTLNAQIAFVEDTTVPFTDVRYVESEFADVDNDGDQDVLITGTNNAGIRVAELYINDGFGNFSLVTGTPFLGVTQASVNFADVDNDNDLDVLIVGFSVLNSPRASLYINDGLGNFTLAVGTPFVGTSRGAADFADIDSDGDLDVIVTGYILANNPINAPRLYVNDGLGNFSLVTGTNFAIVDYGDCKFKDVDGDNDEDLIIIGSVTSTSRIAYIYSNDGLGNFSLVLSTAQLAGVQYGAVDFADVDGDSDYDVVVTGNTGGDLTSNVYLNDGLGAYTLSPSSINITGIDRGGVAFGDVNNDGNPDIMINGRAIGGNIAKLYRADCYGNYTEVIGMPFQGLEYGDIDFADVDGDGDLDVLISGTDSINAPVTKLYLNESIPETNNPDAFITTWETTAPNESITIPTTGAGYNYDVDWGDGNITTGETGDAIHSYVTAGTYEVTISGTFPRIYFGGSTAVNRAKIKAIDQWGCNPWITMNSAFSGCTDLVVNATDTPNLINVTSLESMFSGATSLGGGTGNWDWNTGNITTMSSMFNGATLFNQDISSWDVSNVTLMSHMFYEASSFNQDIGSWNVSNVTTMTGLFYRATVFNQDIGSWNVGNVTQMGSVFREAFAFNQDIGSWDTSSVFHSVGMFMNATSFNQNINGWDVSNILNFSNMFESAIAFNQDLSNWYPASAIRFTRMFANTTFNQDIGNWDTSSVQFLSGMFFNATSFDQDLGNWDVSNVTTAASMFSGVTLSIANYDSLLIGWDAQNLNSNVGFSGGNSLYCAGEAARANMIATDFWNISDGGSATPTIDVLSAQNVSGNFTFPIITGTNLSGGEAYYTGSNGTGTMYTAGDVINYADFASYPITLYIYDSPYSGCEAEENFDLTITDGCEFITTWETIVVNQTITIPTATTGEIYNYNVDWGDGNTTVGATAAVSHVYATVGTHQITITGLFPRIRYSGVNSPTAIVSIDQWGCNPWTSMSYAFAGCSSLVINATDTPNLSNLTDTSHMFSGATSLGGGTGNWNWDTSNLIDMQVMFGYTTNFNKDISSWDTSNVQIMNHVFTFSGFNNTLNTWDTSSVTAMSSMFSYTPNFNQPLNNWDTSSVITMVSMFSDATSFNQDIGSWNTSSVTSLSSMFNDATVFNQDLGNWDTSSVTDLGSMFRNAVSFNQNIGSWDVENVTYAVNMFNGVPMSIANYDSLLIGWNAQNLNPNVNFSGNLLKYCAGESARANMMAVHTWGINDAGQAGATVIDLPDTTATSLYVLPVITGTNLSGTQAYYTGSGGTGTMYNTGDIIQFSDFPSYPITLYIYDGLPASCTSEESFQLTIDSGCEFITTWETPAANQIITIPTDNINGEIYNYNIDWGDGNTTVGATGDASHTYLAAGTYQITITGLFPRIYFHGTNLSNQYNIKSIDQWGCNAWETMGYAFSGCRFLVVNATDVPNLSNVTDTSYMFYQAKDLGDGTGNWNWDTSTITDMSLMFSGANTFNKDIGGWDTSNVMDMHNMFQQAWNFNQNINGWNTAMVTDMGAMFSEASDFNQPLNNWDTSSVTNFGSMFDRALVFNQDIGNWNTSQANNFSNMFGGAIVFNQDIGAWNTSNATHMTDMFYSAVEFDQDLGNWNVENVLYANGMFNLATLSITNYDSLLIGWNAQNLQPDVWFHGGFSQYCAGEVSRTNMITSDNWYIQDGGFAGPTVDDLVDQNVSGSFTFPAITGTSLSGNEAYYTGPNGTGTMYNAGDVINYIDFATYPITLYIYDSVNDGCESQEDFELTITIPPPCTSLDTPLNGSVDVLIGTNLTWNLVSEATGYLLTVGTTSGGTEILNGVDVGNVLTYDLPADLPEHTIIYVSIIPYNADGDATGCTEESFTTEDLLFPPNCTSLSSPITGSVNIPVDTDLTWAAVTEATGYILTVGTSSGGTDILNAVDVGNVLTYDLPADLPEHTTIYVSIIPYNTD
ncbi:BspA family leucine-rich repeat surface protein, partial [Winogradskyella eximia]|uniref:BspA family leucine-rich repeat surface protein n=1 Tax=Winogradskyella eximia TaxID=262006 RepID=UPI000E263CB8